MLEIKETNFGFNNEDRIKIVHRKKTEDKWRYITQASPDTFAKMVDRYISINYNEHYIKEEINILRCFNCQQYHHKGAIALLGRSVRDAPSPIELVSAL